MTGTDGQTIPLPDGEGQLWVEVAGQGPALVFIHGFGLDMAMWDRQFEHFSRTHQVIRYDLRGFGRSSRPVGAYDHVADLVHLLKALGVSSASLVGLSLGANVALNLALVEPGVVNALVVASPGLAGYAWTQARPPEEAQAHAKQYGVESAQAFWFEHALFASTRAIPQASADLQAAIQRYDGWHWENANPMRPFGLTEAGLADIAIPSLVLSGALDVEGYREIAQIVAAGLPAARLVVFADAGHMMNLDDPDGFNAQVRSMLEKSLASGANR